MLLGLRHLISGAFLGTINTHEMMSARRVGSPCSIVILHICLPSCFGVKLAALLGPRQQNWPLFFLASPL